MPQKERAHLSGGPIPNVVLADNSELNTEILRFQASQIVQRAASRSARCTAMHPPDPEMQRAARQGDPNCKSSYSNSNNIEPVRAFQAFRLVSKFGFAFQTAAVVASLAMGDRTLTVISFERLHNITGGKTGVTDAPCPICGLDRRSAANRQRKVFRMWCDSPSFISYRCARCEICGYVHDGSTRAPDPDAIERAKAKAKEQQRIEAIDSLKTSQWLWARRSPIAGTIAETYLRECRGYGGFFANTHCFFLAHGEDCAALSVAGVAARVNVPGGMRIGYRTLCGCPSST